MISKSARVMWMINMLQSCFGHNNEESSKIDENDDLTKALEKFLKGKMGNTLLVYYQKPIKLNERNEKIEYSTPQIYINEAKNVELRNRAAFFQRVNIPEGKELSSEQLQNPTDNTIIYGEISSDSVIGMNKVIYNYLYNQMNDVDWGDLIEKEQKDEFKKIIETFAKDLNDTVDALIKGVKFSEIPKEIKENLLKDNNKEYIGDESSINTLRRTEEIFQSWIDTLATEAEDMDNNPIQDEGPRSELEKWKYRLQRLTKANDFFKSNDYRIIQRYFNDSKLKNNARIQNLINDMKQKRIESLSAQYEARDNLKYIQTLEIYFQPLYVGTPETIIDSLQSLMNSLKLISFTARYYDNTKMTNLFSRVTDQMINNCKAYILDKKKNFTNDDPVFLWQQQPGYLIQKFKICKDLYENYKHKYREAKSNTSSTNKENKFEFSEHQLFGKFDQFCKRLQKLIDLFTTIRQFADLKSHKIDSMESLIEVKYDKQLETFKNKVNKLLDFQNTKFDKEYVVFNLTINEIEDDIHKIIHDEFKNISWIEKKLKLLTKYEKIFKKENLLSFLRNEKIEIYSNYKNEIDEVQKTFELGKTSPKLQKNMPSFSGKIKWAKHLFNRIYPFINNFKDIPIKERSETELSYMTTNTLLYTYIMLNENFFEKFVESAKSKLSAPLLIINETTGPKVNLDLYVLQLIREAKCMLRMNCNIPETAKIILLQEEKFKRYYNELNFLIKEHKRIVSRIGKNESENYFKSHTKDLNSKLFPLKTTVNWSSMNIDTSLAAVFTCLSKFEHSIDSFYEILENRVHRNMTSIRKLDLLHIKENPLNYTFADIIKEQEEKIKSDNLFLLSKSKEIETALIDIIIGIKSYSLDPKVSPVEDSVLYKLIYDYEEKFYEFLTTSTKNSLLSLKDKISIAEEKVNDKTVQGIFRVKVNLSSNMIEIEPKSNVIQETINKLAKSILFAMKGITSWKKPDSEELVSFHNKIGKDTEIIKIIFLLTGSIKKCIDDIEEYLKNTFDSYKPLWTDSIEKKIKEFTTRKDKTEFGYEEKLEIYYKYEEKLKEYTNIDKNISNIKDDITIGAISLNMVNIKNNLKHYCNSWKSAYAKELVRTTRGCAKELHELIKSFKVKLKNKPEKIDELKQTIDTLQEIRSKEGEIDMQIKPLEQFYDLVKEHSKSETEFERYKLTPIKTYEEDWKDVLKKSVSIRDEIETEQTNFKKKLFQEKKKLEESIRDLKNEYDLGGPTKAKSPEEAIEILGRLEAKVKNFKNVAQIIEDGEKIFNYPVSNYPQLKEMDNDLIIYSSLYGLYDSVLKKKEEWSDIYLRDFPLYKEQIELDIADFDTRKGKVNKRLQSDPAFSKLTELINQTNKCVEAFKSLDYPNYEPVHWEQIATTIGVEECANVKNEGGDLIKLKRFFDAGIHNFTMELEEINGYGHTQQKVKDSLAQMDVSLKTCDFEFKTHPKRKEVFLFNATNFDEKKSEIEEHAGKITQAKTYASKLTSELNSKIKAKEACFGKTLSTMELWIQIQNSWNNLQSFFIGGEIKKELPGAAKLFESADKEFVKLMERGNSLKNIMTLCQTGEILNTLQSEIEHKLKDCQNKLDIYLENKRTDFPRFYFCSNSLLLDILSKGSEPANIRININNIFDAVNDIEFDEIDKKIITKIMQVKSAQNRNDRQEVELKNHSVKCEGKIEIWLNTLVDAMQNSLRDMFCDAYDRIKFFFDINIEKEREAFKKFIMDYICQTALFGLQIIGTKKLEDFVKRTSSENKDTYKKKVRNNAEKDPTKEDFNVIQSILQELCRKDYSKQKLEIVKLETLIIVQVHNIDIFNSILEYENGCIKLDDYDWLKQTRVYFDFQGMKTCLINITDVAFEYGYEFLGSKERLCITELTDKCYITLAQAMGMNYGGAPAGPAGTGKTETTKDMGRSMGVLVLVTNCGPEQNFYDMAIIFKGLCKSGAWGCFDEFNRILLDVLSVLAMIIIAIQNCRRENKDEFPFPDTSINTSLDMCKLKGTTGYFITMNPTYAGRQALPENLKVLFRGVTMMLPSRQQIIRVKLSSYGFDNSDDLSKKFKKLYDLCEAQLSKQTHYDFGLRNILSVLRHAGNEKKLEPNPDKEEELIFVALRDMNESKLVPDDIQLFKSLLEDVFPTQKKVAQKQYPKLEAKIKAQMEKKFLDTNNPKWIKKIIQAYETSIVRHGFIIVGPTGTGKTTIMEVLTASLSEDSEIKWKIHRLNPKSVENQYLFIESVKGEYFRGVFTEVWKKCNEATSSDFKKNNWLVCDGPVDTTWIESLNTVLDDNKILTLSNNDRIPMADSCRCVFECENVKNASLATVSRNGMIYITEEDISYSPFFTSWFIKYGSIYFKDVNKAKESELKDLIINKYFNNNFYITLNIVTKFPQCMNVSWIIRIKNFLLLIEALLREFSTKREYEKGYLEKVTVFALVWSIGSLYDESDKRRAFHKLLQDYGAPIPALTAELTIFDYQLDHNSNSWIEWKTVEYPNLKNEIDKFSQLLVPTMDSTRSIYLINRISDTVIDMDKKNPCLILGDTGTAKTSTILLYNKLELEAKKIVLKRINFSSATTTTNFQNSIDDVLTKGTGHDYLPASDKETLVFIDDMSMPNVDKWGDQMTLELARQLLESSGYYYIDRINSRGQRITIKKMSYIAAMNHPKGGKNDIPGRLKRQFFIFNMILPGEKSINDIYGKIIELRFPAKLSESLNKQANKTIKFTYDLLDRMKSKFPTSPIKFHYNFNMRELSRTFQGIFKADKECIKNSAKLYNIEPEIYLMLLWKHEATRVFSDKLREVDDISKYKLLVDELLSEKMSNQMEILSKEYLFCDYMRQATEEEQFPKVYEIVKEIEELRKISEEYQVALNQNTKLKGVSLVLFDDCLKYLIKLTRNFMTKQGSVMLVGVGGSGKQSLTRLASYICQHSVKQLNANNADNVDNLKALYREIYNDMIKDYNPTIKRFVVRHTFLMTDAELKLDSFLETVSSFLATGEIANLYPKKDDKNEILSLARSMLIKMSQSNQDIDENQVWTLFIAIVRDDLHMSLCLSPSSDSFRQKFIKFPILFNNCTIIWCLPWPEDALISVAKGAINKDPAFKLTATDQQVMDLYKHMACVHVNIDKVCKEYDMTLKRKVYVTPKSFLTYIDEYVKIYKQKRSEITVKEVVIQTGLAKLDEAEKDINIQSVSLGEISKVLEEDKKKVEAEKNILIEENKKISILEAEVSEIERNCMEKKEKIEGDKEIVEAELGRAYPIMKNAEKAITDVPKIIGDITKLPNPSNALKFFIECSHIVFMKRLPQVTDYGRLKRADNNNDWWFSFGLGAWKEYVLPFLSNPSTGTASEVNKMSKKVADNNLDISDETLELIRPYIEATIKSEGQVVDINLFAEAEKIAGKQGLVLASFCTNLKEYIMAVRDVLPKKKALAEAEANLKFAMEELAEQQEKKRKVLEKKYLLEQNLRQAEKELEEKEESANSLKKKLDSAKGLIRSLSFEKEKWKSDFKMFDMQKKRLLGDSSICSAFLGYAGPFNFDFRQKIINEVLKKNIEERKIPFTDDIDVTYFLVDDQTKGKWALNQLPSDTVSIQNAILVTFSSRYPLFIDPQNQAKNWLICTYPSIETDKRIYQQKVLVEKSFNIVIPTALEYGEQIMIEGIENDVDSKFDPILEKQLIGTSKKKKLRLGDAEVEFNDKFKMYILCKLLNPHFTPELAAKTTIIDFCITPVGLEQQLQGVVISLEQKGLEETLKIIFEEITQNKILLDECQKNILDNLNRDGSLLDNEDIVGVLNASKAKSEEVKSKNIEAEDKKKDINFKREKYLPVATRGAVLYFSIVDMQEISKMYSTSLQQYIVLFKNSIINAIPSNDIKLRVRNIMRKLTEIVYRYVNRGLFEKDKVTFILIICFKILTSEKIDGNILLKQSDIDKFIRAGMSLSASEVKDCPFEYLNNKSDKKTKEWMNLNSLVNHKFNGTQQVFSKLIDKISDNSDKFKLWYLSYDPENNIPFDDIFNSYNEKLQQFYKLMFIRSFREDRTNIFIQQSFVPKIVDDDDFLKVRGEDIKNIYELSTCTIPILYLLSAGADPSSDIRGLAEVMKKKVTPISMGQNMDKVAEMHVNEAVESGNWVLLENCHLGLKYMNDLDTLLKSDKEFNPDMRIWLSCSPDDKFPIGLLHQSLKVTNEPPKGLIAGMTKTFSSVVNQTVLDEFFFREWKNLVFTLSFMHSLVIERRKYGPLGWCNPYDFNDSDIKASIDFVKKQFKRGMDSNDKEKPSNMINFVTLKNVVSVILYGGRIFDDEDNELFSVIAETYLERKLFDKPDDYYFYPTDKDKASFVKGGPEYKLPNPPDGDSGSEMSIEKYIEYISNNFPRIDPPQVFGLHATADLTFRLKEFGELLETIVITLPKDGSASGGQAADDELKNRVINLISAQPPDFIEDEYRPRIKSLQYGGRSGLDVPLHNVLLQEIIAVQNINVIVIKSLRSLLQALEGTLIMTDDILSIKTSMTELKPPRQWTHDTANNEISWLTNSVTNWHTGLILRNEKLKEWLYYESGNRPAFWLPGFINPKGFFAAFRQEVYKTKKDQPGAGLVTLDMINLTYKPDKSEADPEKWKLTNKRKPDKGVVSMVVYGLYIEGCIWDGFLKDDSNESRNVISLFPVIVVTGDIENKNATNNTNANTNPPYRCPLYKYPRRTDGYLIDYIYLQIKSDTKSSFWKKRGVALLCNKD